MIMSIESLLQHADNMLPTWKQLFQPMPLCPVTPEKKLEKTARLNWQKLGLHQKSSKRESYGSSRTFKLIYIYTYVSIFSYIKLQPTSLWRGKVDPIHSTDAKLCVVRLAMICCQATATIYC